jgi:hypothetical protein
MNYAQRGITRVRHPLPLQRQPVFIEPMGCFGGMPYGKPDHLLS